MAISLRKMPDTAIPPVQSVLDALVDQLTPDAGLWIAFSGGLDSTVLLHAVLHHPLLSRYPLSVIHVNHGLSEHAFAWQKHCLDIAKKWLVNIHIIPLDTQPAAGESIEAWARTQRYDAFKRVMSPGDILLLAHHLNDQAETLLLRLCRGHGPTGLSAMPAKRQLTAQTSLLRPFLSVPKSVLQDYANYHRLLWLEDPSNVNQQFDRNYMRHAVMPDLLKRWPSVLDNIARSADLCYQETQIVQKWAQVQMDQWPQVDESCLSIQALQSYSLPEQVILLRHWLYQAMGQYPTHQSLDQIMETVIDARSDASPCLSLGAWQLRRFRACLYLLCAEDRAEVPSNYDVIWDGCQPLSVPGQSEPLTQSLLQKQGLAIDQLDWHQVRVRFRQGGERCHPEGRAHGQTLKKLLQEYHIPPWRRDRLPLIFCAEKLVMVVGAWVCQGFVLDITQK